ncbi:MAG: hypothetical protein SGILL_008034 [Bacillariaceae sp.]
MELNPRRLSLEFSKQGKLRQDLAPTPTNNDRNCVGREQQRAEQAPTPNNNNHKTDWVLGSTMASMRGSKTNNPSVRQPSSIPSIEIVPKQLNKVSSRLEKSRGAVLNNANNNSDVPATPIRERTNRLTQRWREQDEVVNSEKQHEDSPSSAESASAFLIGNRQHHSENSRIERGISVENDEDDSSSEDSRFSEATPPSVRDKLESRDDDNDRRHASYSDSKLYAKSRLRRKAKVPPVMSYLQLGDEGSLLPQSKSNSSSIGTEIMALPKSIEVCIEDMIGDERESDSGPKTTTTRGPTGGRVLQRFRTNKVPFQELNGDMFSYDESFQDGNESIIKKATSETEESDSGIHVAGRYASSWDRFERDYASDGEDDDILISSSSKKIKKRRRKRTWILWVLVCSVIICLAGGLPIYFYMTRHQDQTNSMPTSKPPPLLGPMDYDTCVSLHGNQASDYSERYSSVRQLLRLTSVGRTSMIDESGSAQRKALCWLSVSDNYVIEISEGNEFAIIQRYSLAVLYHSLVKEDDGFADSLVNSDFLSDTPECEWDVVMCSKPSIVSVLLLSDKNLSGKLPPEVGNLEGLSKFLSYGN